MKKLFLLCFSMVLSVGFVLAQDLNLNANINPDPHVRIGKLSNGLTYYIRHNETPKGRVELRLAVNAGSNQENDDQQGLAHFTEHMAFNGIEGFSGNEMIDQLRSIGVVFGADLNAYTSFDETVYMIPMPLDKSGNLDLGFKIRRGWAHGVGYDNAENDAERGVISEEYRLGLGADDRMRKTWWPVLMQDSRYAVRMPIGKLDIIQNFSYQTIKDFYNDWYRPDLQAVIVVGDIDVDEVESKIKTLFEDIPAVENPRVKESYAIGFNQEPLVSVATDKEASGSTVMLIRKFPHFAMKTVGDYRKQLTIDLYNEMYSSRLEEMTQDPKCPFLYANTGYGELIGSTDNYTSYAASKENRIPETIETLIKEDNRVLQYGFLQTELKRAKEAILEQLERAANEVDKTESEKFASDYIDHFLHGDPIPGAKREFNYAKKLMEGVTLEEVNALAKTWITPENLVAIVTAPDKADVQVPTQEQVLNIINDTSLANVTPYVDTYKEKEIVEKSTLTAGSIAKTEELSAIGAKKITLSNGIEILMKKTSYKNDEILFAATSKGGKALYGVNDLASADFATSFIDRSGISDIDYNSLMKKLKTKNVGLTPYISSLTEGFQGSSSPKDLETFFQYLHAFFVSPRIDTTSEILVMTETQEQMKMLQSNGMYRFIAALFKAATDNDPYLINMITYTPEYLEQVNFDRAVEIYQERFANPADFTFIFVGNYDEQVMNDYLCTYLGSLKTSSEREEFKTDVFKKRSTGTTHKEIRYGQEAQGWMGMYFAFPYEYNTKNNITITEIGDVLDILFLQEIREKMGDTYSPMLSMDYDKYPYAEGNLMIMLSCDPEKTDKLADASLKILQDFSKKGPKAKDLEQVKTQLISTREKNIQTNKFWLNYLNSIVLNRRDVNDVNEYNDVVNSITKKDMINFMKSYFDIDSYVRVDLKPE